MVNFNDTGWVNLHSSGCVKYRKKNGIVFVRADSNNDVSIAAKSTLSNISYLPSGCRPSMTMMSAGTLKNFNGYELQIQVYSSGEVRVFNLHPNSAAAYWGGTLSFIAEQ